MTAPNFDFTRPDYGLAQRPDVTRVGQRQPRLTAKEAIHQTARGLAQAGIDLLQLGIAGAGDAVAPGVGTVADVLLSPAVEAQRAEINEYYGKPESGGGRGVSLFARLLGNVAVPLGPLKRAPGASRTALRTVPEVRVATDAEAQRVVEALRRAPPESKEAGLLRDILSGEYGGTPKGKAFEREVEYARAFDQLTPEQLRETRLREIDLGLGNVPPKGMSVSPLDAYVNPKYVRQGPIAHVQPDIRTLEDLLNLRAFGSRRGPFSTSGKHAYDLGDLPPIADADEVFGFTKSPKPIREKRRRFVITEQMRDPDFRSGKAAQQEIHAERLREDLTNVALRDAIIEEGAPDFHRVMGFNTQIQGHPGYTVKIQPRNLWQMFFHPRGTKQ